MLFLTENYAALEILKQYLQDQEGEQLAHSEGLDESSLKPWEMEPFVLFGSSFPRDKEYTQVDTSLAIVYIMSNTFCRYVETSIRLRYAWRLVGQ